MAIRRVTAAAVAMAVVCPAYGDTGISVRGPVVEATSTLALGSPQRAKLDHARVRVDEDGLARVTFTLSSRERTAHAAAITLVVPHGSRARQLAVTIGGVRSVATALDRADASERFQRIVEGNKDPALLELASSTRDGDRLVLRVFPIANDSRAIVDVAIELPAIDRVVVAAMPGQGARTIELPRRSWMTEDPAPRGHVDAATSLFAGVEGVGAVPIVVIGGAGGCRFRRHGYIDKNIIRRYIKRQLPRVRGCWIRHAQYDRTLTGTAELHFTIDGHGRVSDVSVDGTLANEAIEQCFAEELVTWKFPHHGDGATRVNYPLTFVLNE